MVRPHGHFSEHGHGTAGHEDLSTVTAQFPQGHAGEGGWGKAEKHQPRGQGGEGAEAGELSVSTTTCTGVYMC